MGSSWRILVQDDWQREDTGQRGEPSTDPVEREASEETNPADILTSEENFVVSPTQSGP